MRDQMMKFGGVKVKVPLREEKGKFRP